MCFLIGVTGKGFSANEHALLGSVSDNPYDIRTFTRLIKPKDDFSHIGSELISTTEASLAYRGYFAQAGETTRGVNEAGLSFTSAMVFEKKNLSPENLASFASTTEKMLKNCQTVDDAVALFQSQKTLSPAYSVLVADAFDGLAHLEVGSFGVVVHSRYSRERPGMTIAVNCYLSDSLVNFNDPTTLLTNKNNNNYSRFGRGTLLAEQSSAFDVNTLATLLSDHANCDKPPIENPILPAWGYSICNHGTYKKAPGSDLPWGTISSEILEPAAKRFWYVYGWPCGSKPSHSDQIMQEYSWGQFLPFGFNDHKSHSVKLTTPTGAITSDGARWLQID